MEFNKAPKSHEDQLSRFCDGLVHNKDKQDIAKDFGLQQQSLGSDLHALTFIRNICAHHARLWNKRMTITCRKPRNWQPTYNSAWNTNPDQERNIYNVIVLTLFIMKKLAPDNQWGQHLVELLHSYPIVSPGAMGFPQGWENLNVWQDAMESANENGVQKDV